MKADGEKQWNHASANEMGKEMLDERAAETTRPAPVAPGETEMRIDRLSFKKIFFHTDKIHEYLTTGEAYPIHMVVGFTDYCNHNCVWCYTAYSTHNNFVILPDGTYQYKRKTRDERLINPEVLLTFLAKARDKGLKSITIIGSGEPLLHPDSADMMEEIGKMGIDFGVFSNGQPMKENHFDVVTKYASFFRFSLDAADAETYKRLHGNAANFVQTVENIKRLLSKRALRGKSLPTVGAQFVTSQLNAESMVPFTSLMLSLGVDYVAFKPMYDNPINVDRAKNSMSVEEVLQKLEEVKQYQNDDFKVYDKDGEQFTGVWGPQQFNGAVYYQKCMSHQFSPSLYANGDIYVCLNLAGRREYVMGNIYETSLEEIWASEQRKKAINAIDLCHKCPARCKLDPLNKIMWDISHPDPDIHPNFL